MKTSLHNLRVLAVDPYDCGLGFAVFEGTDELVDWGLKQGANRKRARFIESLATLIERYRPDVVVTEDFSQKGSSRRRQTLRVLKRIRGFAKQHNLRLRTYSRAAVEDAFALIGASKNKHQIATVIAGWFPELAARLPKPQKSWTGENRSMNVFDAVSFALTFFHQENHWPLTARRSPQLSLSARGGITGSVSPGNDQGEEDASRLSSPMPAFPPSRTEKISPTIT